ncbi:MAG: hypothetical protein ACI9BO_001835 [Zhongshania sp.]|jgi:hypothetical protein
MTLRESQCLVLIKYLQVDSRVQVLVLNGAKLNTIQQACKLPYYIWNKNSCEQSMKTLDIISWSIFPVTVAAVLLGGVWAIDADHAPSLVAGIGTFASLVLVVTLERLLSYRKEWNQGQGDLRADLLYLPSYFGINALVQPLVAGDCTGLMQREHILAKLCFAV